ncbi:MAG TPA: hypothetical protein DIW46_03960 [Microbacterium sp.]|uniref:hypothetical protein n=1 Tax=Microbacterium sp. TaxID=51671 RepID=UPI000EDCAC0A|nr:hypothetical protein [Microbacterium sp.]
MVAHVLRLRLALILGAFRGERVVRTVIGFLALIAATVAVCMAILSLGDAPPAVARTVLVLAGAATFLGFLFGPILTGTTDQLDPRRFGVFGMDVGRMPWILALASLFSIPSFALLAVIVCSTIVVIDMGAPWPVAVLMALLWLVAVALAARVGMATSALLLPERRSRELTALFVLAVVVVAFPVAVFFASLNWDGQVPFAVAIVAAIAGFTPIGAVSAFSPAIASGDVQGAWVIGLVAAATLAVLWLLWSWLVRRLLTSVERPATSRERSGLGWFALLPANAFGAIAARSLVYWLRDRRYIVNFVIVPIAGVLTVFPLVVAGVPLYLAALVPVPVMALFFGWLPHNDVAYDSTAFWTHVASGVRGLSDRFGRMVPVALVAIPVLAIAIPLTLALIESWYLLAPMIGVAASLFLSGLGLSSISSVVSPYAVSRPGDSPFQQPQRSASRGSFGPAAALLGTLLVSAPTLWFFIMTIVADGVYNPITFWVGIGTGIVVLMIAAFIGGRIYDRSGERLMEFVETA